jgi:acyl-CoA reductase-like NAD-dependent aldehyde dehydrogenase
MARGIESGMVFVNSQNVRDLRQPFGGVKASGVGREGGHWSFEVFTENLGRAHRVAAAIEAGMCFVNSQNVRDLRQPFGGTKASGTGREGGTWSYEVFLEPKNVCVSLGSHHIPHWGAA